MQHQDDAALYQTGSLIAGRYEVIRAVGSGGMGWVLHVVDRALNNKSVALKLLYPHLVKDPVSFARFQNEVLLTRDLAHPNIVKIYDIGNTDSGQYFITLEYVHGTSLKDLLAATNGKGLPFPEAIKILAEIAAGIGHAHRKGIVHRDLKPDNILISNVGDVKIVDFGIARSLWQDHGLTKTGGAIGTPYYMSPEQIRGEELDTRCDIYAMGIIAYELVCGERPYDDEHYFNLAQKHIAEPLPPFPERVPPIPGWFQDAVLRATAKDREARFGRVEEFADLIHDSVPTGALRLRTREFFHAAQGAANQLRFRNRIPRLSLAHIGWLSVLFVVWTVSLATLWTNPSWRAVAGRPIVRLENGLGRRLGVLEWLVGIHTTGEFNQDLLTAVSESDKWRVKLFTGAGIDPNVLDAKGKAPIHYAVEFGRELGVLDELLEGGANPNLADAEGNTPLALALELNRLPLAKMLAERGADVNGRNRQGRPFVNIAAAKPGSNFLSLLIQPGVQLLVRDELGNTPLHVAASHSNDMVQLLLRGASDELRNSKNKDGKTPLMIAAENGAADIVTTLIREHANTELRDAAGKTAAELARPDVARLFPARQ